MPRPEINLQTTRHLPLLLNTHPHPHPKMHSLICRPIKEYVIINVINLQTTLMRTHLRWLWQLKYQPLSCETIAGLFIWNATFKVRLYGETICVIHTSSMTTVILTTVWDDHMFSMTTVILTIVWDDHRVANSSNFDLAEHWIQDRTGKRGEWLWASLTVFWPATLANWWFDLRWTVLNSTWDQPVGVVAWVWWTQPHNPLIPAFDPLGKRCGNIQFCLSFNNSMRVLSFRKQLHTNERKLFQK